MKNQFGRIRKRIHYFSIKKRLVLYGYLTITPVLILICLALIYNNYHKTLKEEMQNDLANVKTLADSINILQTEIKNLSTYLCIDSEIQALLKNADETKREYARFWYDEASMKIIQDMLAIKDYSTSLAIYPENGNAPYLYGMDGSVFLPSIQDVRQTETYRETLESENGVLWKYIPKYSDEIFLTSWTDKIVLCRAIYDLSKNPIGYLVMGVQAEHFLELCENMMRDENETVLILDHSGGTLCQTGELNEEIAEFFQTEFPTEFPLPEGEKQFVYKGYNITCVQPDEKASIVCKVVPSYQLSIADIVYMPVVLLLGMMVGLLPLLLIISTTITKPLQKLREAISKFALGDFEQQIPVMTHDEVGEVAECFNHMVGDIKQLINENYVITLREKESELAALQAQINPHFLYNTLDCLYWQATKEGNDEIAESILALSELFRLVLSQGKSEIAVGQEIELISHYLQIQKMRFSKRLSYSIEVEDSVKQALIPKLILQPFVENAVVHGCENVSKPCVLEVTAKKKGAFIQFRVLDTGQGMSQEQINKIWENEPEQYAKQRIGRYAIRNIKERLELKYHDNFKLEIQSSIGEGTIVTLMIPWEV